MLRQLGHDPALLQDALGSIYEQVIVLEPGTFDLWRDGQPYATAACGADACVFHYWDFTARVDAFAQQASMWAEMQIGPLEGEWPLRRAENEALELELNRLSSGAESEMTLRLWTSRD
ncbi:MAG: hypothetical protein AAGM84_07480 [Pseudomonadota bacterium]